MKELLLCIDHTMLKPDAVWSDIKKCCDEAKEYGFGAVCVNGCYVQKTTEQLKDTTIKTVAVAGFPLGTQTTKAKVYEATLAIEQGADEVDMVINVGALKDQDYAYVVDDIKSVVEAIKGKALLKVILETCLLTDEQVVMACQLCEKAGADFVKTSTGFNGPGASVHHVNLMKQTVGNRLKVKAAGGIRTLQQAKDMIEAGADRLGCSASVAIAKEIMN
ncbi:MAG TPA: deoxyribose-phosphate aldolase [Clostridiales bacterium]|nr:deoxyribose-phosphate aldolase [Clostridiales bacterium]